MNDRNEIMEYDETFNEIMGYNEINYNEKQWNSHEAGTGENRNVAPCGQTLHDGKRTIT